MSDAKVEDEIVRVQSALTSAEIFKRDFELRYQEKTREARRVMTERRAMRRRFQNIDTEIEALRARFNGLATEGSEFLRRRAERIKLGGMTPSEKKAQLLRKRKEKVETKVDRIKRQLADLQRELAAAEQGAA